MRARYDEPSKVSTWLLIRQTAKAQTNLCFVSTKSHLTQVSYALSQSLLITPGYRHSRGP